MCCISQWKYEQLMNNSSLSSFLPLFVNFGSWATTSQGHKQCFFLTNSEYLNVLRTLFVIFTISYIDVKHTVIFHLIKITAINL